MNLAPRVHVVRDIIDARTNPSVEQLVEHRIHVARIALSRYMSARAAASPVAIRASRVPAIAALLANSCWWMSSEAREVIADLGLAIFAFDDLVDERELELEELEFRCEQLLDCARGEACPELGFDSTAELLRDVAARLAAAPQAEQLWGEWVREIEACLRGIVASRQIGEQLNAGASLSLDDYLEVALRSMSVVAVCVAVAMLFDDERAVSCRDTYARAYVHAAVATRLSNDLRSFEREQREGSPNVLLLDGVDVETVERRIDSERAAMARDLERLPGGVSRFVVAFTDGILVQYDRGDFSDSEQSMAS